MLTSVCLSDCHVQPGMSRIPDRKVVDNSNAVEKFVVAPFSAAKSKINDIGSQRYTTVQRLANTAKVAGSNSTDHGFVSSTNSC